jgi:hypothetical protein
MRFKTSCGFKEDICNNFIKQGMEILYGFSLFVLQNHETCQDFHNFFTLPGPLEIACG